MRKLSVLFGTLLVCTCAGCGDDTNDQLVANTISQLNNTTSSIEQVAKILTDATAAAKKDSKPLALDKIIQATTEADKLKKQAQILQNIKAQTELRKDVVTVDQREDLAKKHKTAFQAAMVAVDAAQKRLDVAVNDADAVVREMPDGTEDKAKAETAMGNLKTKLKEARDEFEGLTKRQT